MNVQRFCLAIALSCGSVAGCSSGPSSPDSPITDEDDVGSDPAAGDDNGLGDDAGDTLGNGDDTHVESKTWDFVDGGALVGNRPQIINFNGKIYLSWEAQNQTNHLGLQVHVLSGDIAHPTWTAVGGVNGINFDIGHDMQWASFVVFNGKLYAAWSEPFSSPQIHVKVYSGDDAAPSWTSVDRDSGSFPNGFKRDVGDSASTPVLLVHASQLVMVYTDTTSTSAGSVYLATYGGDDAHPSWTLSSAGVTIGAGNTAQLGMSAAEVAGEIVVACLSQPSSGLPQLTTARTADLGATWASTSAAPFNIGTTHTPSYIHLTAQAGKAYLTWTDQGSGSSLALVAVYNGNDAAPNWTRVDGATSELNLVATNTAALTSLGVAGGVLFGSWLELNGGAPQVHVAAYNGNDAAPAWLLTDPAGGAGINFNPAHGPSAPVVFADLSGDLYAAWEEFDPDLGNRLQVRVLH
jgi:hypothetical protein